MIDPSVKLISKTIDYFPRVTELVNFAGSMTRLEHQITTRVFRTGSAAHAIIAAENAAGRWWWAIFAPLSVAAAYGAATDIRWLIAAVALLFLIVPTLVLFGYLSAVSDKDAVAALLPRKARFNTDGSVIVTVAPTPSTDERPTPCASEPMIITPGDILVLRCRKKYLEIVFMPGQRRLLIPLDSFDDPRSPFILAEAFGKPVVNS